MAIHPGNIGTSYHFAPVAAVSANAALVDEGRLGAEYKPGHQMPQIRCSKCSDLAALPAIVVSSLREAYIQYPSVLSSSPMLFGLATLIIIRPNQ